MYDSNYRTSKIGFWAKDLAKMKHETYPKMTIVTPTLL